MSANRLRPERQELDEDRRKREVGNAGKHDGLTRRAGGFVIVVVSGGLAIGMGWERGVVGALVPQTGRGHENLRGQ